MPNFLTRMAARAAGTEPVVQPVIPPIFAPVVESQDIHRGVLPTEQPATFSGNRAGTDTPFHSTDRSYPTNLSHSQVAHQQPAPREPRNATPHPNTTAPIEQPAQAMGPTDTDHPSTVRPVSGEASAAPVHGSDVQSERKEEQEQPAAMERRRITWNDAVEQRIAARQELQPEPSGTTPAAAIERRGRQPESAAMSLEVASRRDGESSAAPVINVSIGRIEVRAVMQQQQLKPVPRPAPTTRPTLEEYLNTGRGKKR